MAAKNVVLNPALQVNGLGSKIIMALDAIDTESGGFDEAQLTALNDDLQALCQKHNIPVPEYKAPLKPVRRKRT